MVARRGGQRDRLVVIRSINISLRHCDAPRCTYVGIRIGKYTYVCYYNIVIV